MPDQTPEPPDLPPRPEMAALDAEPWDGPVCGCPDCRNDTADPVVLPSDAALAELRARLIEEGELTAPAQTPEPMLDAMLDAMASETPEPLTDEQLAHWIEYEDFDLSADDAIELVEQMARELLEERELSAYLSRSRSTEYIDRPRALSLIHHLMRSRHRWMYEAEGNRQRSVNMEQLADRHFEGFLAARARITELEVAAARCQATTVEPIPDMEHAVGNPGRTLWCSLPHGHAGMHNATIPQLDLPDVTVGWVGSKESHA